MGLIEDAQRRAAEREAIAPHRIDYDRMNKVFPKQKAALTRAVNSGDPERVAKVCKEAVQVWNEIGAWPDDWGRFNRALNDMLPWNQQVDLADL